MAAPKKPAPKKPAPKKPAPAKPAKPEPTKPAKPAPTKPSPTKPTPTKPTAEELAYAASIRKATEAVPFSLVVIDGDAERTFSENASQRRIAPPTYFAVVAKKPSARPYHFLFQKDHEEGHLVLLQLIDQRGTTRVPATPAWQRAIVDGTVHLVASDLPLSRDDIALFNGGGHEPPTSPARPPFL